ncbi:hypothetical protein FRC20_009778 [Serendipita sp. 405]|nr:hypothetical protein FRC20_009778 [Serendipita sp. 405]
MGRPSRFDIHLDRQPSMAYHVNKEYKRDEAIILSFDIGTTHTAVSFSHAIPGEHPDVRPVMKWPGQPEASGETKIPTIIAYQDGEAKYFGAEARDLLEDDEYEIARWFKLHLHPDSMKPDRASNGPESLETPPLPQGVSLAQVYSDFIGYVYRITKNFFINNTPNGQQMWNRLGNQMPIVFCTPNGWDLRQHAVLTDASIRAGIVTEGNADDRLWFLTEGEASVHYSLAHTKTNSWLNKGTIFAVMDVGGSTVDSTLYRCQSRSPLVLEEVCASACVQAGGIFVDRAIREILERKLSGSEYCDPETISLIIRQFEQKTKRAFDGSQTANVIQFGSNKDNDKNYDIVKGKLTLSREEVEEAYLEVISSIVDNCNILLANRNVQVMVIVFYELPLFRQNTLASYLSWWFWGIALPEGKTEVYSWGEEDRSCDDRGTFDTIFNGKWESVLYKGALLLDRFKREDIRISLFSWRGDGPPPHILVPSNHRAYKAILPPGLEEIMCIKADLGTILDPTTNFLNLTTGMPYWEVALKIELSFQSMKLRAKMRWSEEVLVRHPIANYELTAGIM